MGGGVVIGIDGGGEAAVDVVLVLGGDAFGGNGFGESFAVEEFVVGGLAFAVGGLSDVAVAGSRTTNARLRQNICTGSTISIPRILTQFLWT